MAVQAGVAPLDRANLLSRTLAVLSRGGWAKADVRLVRDGETLVIVKDFGTGTGLLRRWVSPWFLRREMRAYRCLADHPCVPRLIRSLDRRAFVLEYRPGEPLSRSLRGRISETFISELRSAIRGCHARGVVHLDLRHRSNVLAGEDGRPVLLDFASAICIPPERGGLTWILRLLRRIDESALRKWEQRLESQDSGAPASCSSSGTNSEGSRGDSRPM